MTAVEMVEGLTRLGVLHETTLPYSPAMNGKIETLWGLVEGRFLAMLEDVRELSLNRSMMQTSPGLAAGFGTKTASS